MANVTAMLQKPLCGNQMNLATLSELQKKHFYIYLLCSYSSLGIIKWQVKQMGGLLFPPPPGTESMESIAKRMEMAKTVNLEHSQLILGGGGFQCHSMSPGKFLLFANGTLTVW